jgi:hypothetical protein
MAVVIALTVTAVKGTSRISISARWSRTLLRGVVQTILHKVCVWEYNDITYYYGAQYQWF